MDGVVMRLHLNVLVWFFCMYITAIVVFYFSIFLLTWNFDNFLGSRMGPTVFKDEANIITCFHVATRLTVNVPY